MTTRTIFLSSGPNNAVFCVDRHGVVFAVIDGQAHTHSTLATDYGKARDFLREALALLVTPDMCENPWHDSAPVRRTMECAECHI